MVPFLEYSGGFTGQEILHASEALWSTPSPTAPAPHSTLSFFLLTPAEAQLRKQTETCYTCCHHDPPHLASSALLWVGATVFSQTANNFQTDPSLPALKIHLSSLTPQGRNKTKKQKRGSN